MSTRKKTGSSALTLGSAVSSGPTLSRVGVGVNRLNLVASRREAVKRDAKIDELATMISQLFPQPEQAAAISALKSADGEPFFTLQNKARFMDVRALIRKEGFDATLTLLQKLPSADELINETPLLDSVRQNQQREDELLTRNEEVTEGEYTCGNPNCKSRRIGRRIKQTRSADEAPTVFLRCTACANRWKEG